MLPGLTLLAFPPSQRFEHVRRAPSSSLALSPLSNQPHAPSADVSTSARSSLLGVSALAGSGDNRIPPGQIILLPLLFMAAMTAVDSTDSVFMLMAYTVPQRTAAAEAGLLVEKGGDSAADPAAGRAATGRRWWDIRGWVLFERRPTAEEEQVELRDAAERARMLPQASEDKLLNISVVLTVISIVVALLISIVRPLSLSLSRPEQGGRERALTLLLPFPFLVSSSRTDRVHGVRPCALSLLLRRD